MDEEEQRAELARAELARILRDSAARVEGTTTEAREEAERQQAEFARRLRVDPTIVYDGRES